ncbi:MAG: YihA family ribosome biogenesis GTP-binding protein [Gammaproteobacteria bacterium]|jgi:GTP-binding protein|nr:YihA family ribosome biogenesis GTP-binding protein [Gammaproteobacteria bacterium]MBT5202796.1 YihA family ribosome biogenesis GTP-binding protein [Gammaproteobacteria bacterium]MBT5603092.1 YihA family ribosome biogenesis GTP-binding protein [Gammaproteobacteria bacterium]MBT6246872.1 YihA family ribosome biogenesis GTP-binding protein [Gammaproteobacteria bacterium]
MIDFSKAQFQTSASKLNECPNDVGIEIAFCGRSNAGKSSAINTLTRQKKLARTSKTPGRTQLLNFFSLTENLRLVDLPGYGYAKVPTSIKQHWHKHLDEYLRGRSCLRGLVLLMDIRHPLRTFDQTMISWCNDTGLALHILLTKADKLKRGAQQNTLLGLTKALPSEVSIQTFSAQNSLGLNELEKKLLTWIPEEETEPENEF